MKINSKHVLTLFILAAVCLTSYAQKLPVKQEISLRAPAGIKIDGKATEWRDKFQAYNKATDIYYTLSNDDENLYLVVQAIYQDVKDKILRGGITFTINHTLNKRDEAHVSVTYPVLRNADMSVVSGLLAVKSYPKANGDTPTIMNVNDLNQVMAAKSKLIDILGITAIPDKSISVYNQDGIKAVAQFDNHVAYTYELAIPLKYLKLPNNGKDKFIYNIKINEPAEVHLTRGDKLPPPMAVSDNAPGIAPTDFWGEYTLAKK